MEYGMTYTLDAFIVDAKTALQTHNGPAGREQVRLLLEKLLTNSSFVDEAVGPGAPSGTRKLYEDKDLGFVGGLWPGHQIHRHDRIPAGGRR